MLNGFHQGFWFNIINFLKANKILMHFQQIVNATEESDKLFIVRCIRNLIIIT